MKYRDKETFDKANHFGTGDFNEAYAQYFSGDSFLNNLGATEDGSLVFHNVTFEPGCRNDWHIHHASKGGGQILICTAGEGWYQAEGEEAVPLKEGSLIIIPANVKHWHGAKKDSWFSHIALGVPGQDLSNEWCEPVSDEEYGRLAD
ncbi:cupin domain-containing protein [Streptococcus troglodytae]|uniref:Carboxymuconolactone decarboxylase n=1 Tax=Streptococcus troglodytae TaxID=1111760 RepID=A0A1L7LJY1_9STRE|nr:cupin domain-containing protein [Streptococcus troglodytae]BAQ24466.1 carboxymuconolactone decarboxylase [Streptococcus troglodytae]